MQFSRPDINGRVANPEWRRVRWFRASPAAKPLPFPTAFCSSDWDNIVDADSRLGENVYEASKNWSPGQTPITAPGSGPPCGTPEEFLHGIPVPTVPYEPPQTIGLGGVMASGDGNGEIWTAETYDAFEIPLCCGFTFLGAGGVMIGSSPPLPAAFVWSSPKVPHYYSAFVWSSPGTSPSGAFVWSSPLPPSLPAWQWETSFATVSGPANFLSSTPPIIPTVPNTLFANLLFCTVDEPSTPIAFYQDGATTINPTATLLGTFTLGSHTVKLYQAPFVPLTHTSVGAVSVGVFFPSGTGYIYATYCYISATAALNKDPSGAIGSPTIPPPSFLGVATIHPEEALLAFNILVDATGGTLPFTYQNGWMNYPVGVMPVMSVGPYNFTGSPATKVSSALGTTLSQVLDSGGGTIFDTASYWFSFGWY